MRRPGVVRAVCVGAALLLGAGLLPGGGSRAAAQTTAFSYQGRLLDGGRGASGEVDLRLTLYSEETGGQVLAGPVEHAGVAVEDGLFSVMPDFGDGAFWRSGALWLGVEVRPAGAGAWTALEPRTRIGSVPAAVRALSAGTADDAGSEETPPTASGLPAGTAVETTIALAGAGGVKTALAGEVEVAREVAFGRAGQVMPGAWRPAEVTVRRPWQTGSDWRSAFLQGLRASVTITVAFEDRETVYSAGNGLISGHRIVEGSNGGPVEEMMVTFSSSAFSRSVAGPVGGVPPRPTPPAGAAYPSQVPGPLSFSFGGVSDASRASVLPEEGRAVHHDPQSGQVQPASGARSQPVAAWRNALADGTWWSEFVQGRARSLVLASYANGEQPLVELSDRAIVSAWRLRIADDGLPVEEYEFVYGVD